MTMVYIRHLREQKLCLRGCRDWFAAHGIDWNDFITNGVEADRLRATGDHYGIATANLAEAEARK